MLLELGVAVGGGILNALSGSAEDREMEQRKQRAMALLRENIIDPDELDTMLNNVNRLFNNRLVNTLNSTALRSRGIANNSVVKGVVASGIESARLGATTDTYNKALENNAQVNAQMAQTELGYGDKHNFFGDFVGGAVAAAPIGIELSKMLGKEPIETGMQPRVAPGLDKYMDDNPPDLYGNLKSTNSFWGKQKIEDEDLVNFGYSRVWSN